MIPKNLGRDPDFKRFNTELQDTDAGLRWRRAWNDMHRALKLIPAPGTGPQPLHVAEHYRREYLKASERASDALSELARRFDWPKAARAPSTFMWQPTAQGPRRSRNAR